MYWKVPRQLSKHNTCPPSRARAGTRKTTTTLLTPSHVHVLSFATTGVCVSPRTATAAGIPAFLLPSSRRIRRSLSILAHYCIVFGGLAVTAPSQAILPPPWRSIHPRWLPPG
ncbi:hypothetical protein P154DRAFT_230173 [Amniculicola lignicola CBS 123094]|uniref:Uncharacterized protein n=1 Tax=Amniculicola lignicola CBS 123094 TaxID=1392246 RepID=A0A6A5WCH1_9PLEO|nr:hypothetical protein P154DRAFT_230173 [Amniculicola lignicola CBS 123094]